MLFRALFEIDVKKDYVLLDFRYNSITYTIPATKLLEKSETFML